MTQQLTLVPENPSEIHETLDLSRQFLIIQGVADLNFVLIGAGGIGSNTAYMLACLGAKEIIVFDDDIVEPANVSPAFYGNKDVGKFKVEALAARIEDMTGVEIYQANQKYIDQEIRGADVVVVSTDGLDKRRSVWKKGRHKLDWRYWIDARMGGAVCSTILLLNRVNIMKHRLAVGEISQDEFDWGIDLAKSEDTKEHEKYEDTHLTGANAQQPCGEKATAFITKGTVQGLIGEAIYNILNHRRLPANQIRDAEQTLSITGWVS